MLLICQPVPYQEGPHFRPGLIILTGIIKIFVLISKGKRFEMKYILLFVFAVLSFYVADAQLYSCVVPGQKHYFTNNLGYLRGIRIDSVKLIDGNTVYYPFKTARLPYQGWTGRADTTGGSWLGKVLIETPGGYTRIPNLWGDTVTIKHGAAPGDPWVFYSDTTARYYQAEVIAMDTLTIDAVIDSVKIIGLAAMQAGSLLPDDSLTGLRFILSKAHGLIQTTDLFLFPYHKPGENHYNTFFDCHFYEANGGYELQGASLLFKKVDFMPADKFNIFDYRPGDIFYSSRNVAEASSVNPISKENIKTMITSRADSDTMITYGTFQEINGTVYPQHGALYPVHTTNSNGLQVKAGLLIDTLYMPEEWRSRMPLDVKREPVQHYFPEDSSYCTLSAKYVIRNSALHDGYFRPRNYGITCKNGFGVVSRGRAVIMRIVPGSANTF